MSIGENIRRIREERGLTQENLADKLDVSFQSVSAWERDVNHPDVDNLVRISDVLNVGVDALVRDNPHPFVTTETLFDMDRMKTYIKTVAREHGLKDTLNAADFAKTAHEGQYRKHSAVPYFYHPLNLACHALAMGLYDDALISACLLHDVVEDCGVRTEDLPAGEETKEIVRLLSKEENGVKKQNEEYYQAILENPKACVVKCLDRCNNMTTMVWGFSRNGMRKYIRETDRWYPQMLRVIKAQPEYYHAAWLLKYQIESMADIYKRFLQG